MAEETKLKDSVASKEMGDKIIRNHMLGAMGVGFIPIPIIDFVGVTGVQINMLRKLAKAYQVPFNDHKVKNIITSLVGGAGALPISLAFSSLIKFVPVIGTTIGAVSLPISAGAVTYAIGKVFLQHFASGGTFLTFDPDKVRNYYAEMFNEGKLVASAMNS